MICKYKTTVLQKKWYNANSLFCESINFIPQCIVDNFTVKKKIFENDYFSLNVYFSLTFSVFENYYTENFRFKKLRQQKKTSVNVSKGERKSV